MTQQQPQNYQPPNPQQVQQALVKVPLTPEQLYQKRRNTLLLIASGVLLVFGGYILQEFAISGLGLGLFILKGITG